MAAPATLEIWDCSLSVSRGLAEIADCGPCCGMMPYPPDYDRLLQEARALASDEADAAKSLVAASKPPRERAMAAAALLGLRARLSTVLAGIADGQAGASHSWVAAQPSPHAGYATLADALATLEQRLAGLREQGLAPY